MQPPLSWIPKCPWPLQYPLTGGEGGGGEAGVETEVLSIKYLTFEILKYLAFEILIKTYNHEST